MSPNNHQVGLLTNRFFGNFAQWFSNRKRILRHFGTLESTSGATTDSYYFILYEGMAFFSPKYLGERRCPTFRLYYTTGYLHRSKPKFRVYVFGNIVALVQWLNKKSPANAKENAR